MELGPALGVNLKDYSPDILKGKLWRISEKIDGVRRLFHKDVHGKVRAYSRTGKADRWLGHITTVLESDRFPEDMIYDTELVDLDLYFSQVDSFVLRAETTGKAGQQYPANKHDLGAICFDMFKPDGDISSGEERHKLLLNTFSSVPLYSPITHVPYFGTLNGYDEKVLSYLMRSVVGHKGEGLMLMNLATPYIHGRSKELIKVKRNEEYVGTVIDMEFGLDGTKIEGGIASLICTVPGCSIPIRVGSGFTNEERIYFAKHPPLGVLIEIEAFGRTKNRNGTISLSMPIFKQIKEG